MKILNEQDLSLFRSNLCIWTCKFKRNKVKSILEYVDISSGEILLARDVKIKTSDSKFMLERNRILDSLTDSQRKLALFILDFRNRACGFLIPIEEILSMYSKYSDQRKDSVKRSFEALIPKGVMQDKYTLAQPFMLYNKNRNSTDAKGDVTRAGIIFDIKMLEKTTGEKCNVEIYT